MSVGRIRNPLADGDTITSTTLDASFDDISNMINGNLHAENFRKRAGFALKNRATHGNQHFLFQQIGLFQKDANDSLLLMDISAESVHLDVPAVLKIRRWSVFAESVNPDPPASVGNTVTIQYRTYNVRTATWLAWTTILTIAAGATEYTDATAANQFVIGEGDYSRLQIRLNLVRVAGTQIVRGLSLYLQTTALHLP